MTTISVKDQIKRLVELQAMDVEVYRFKVQLREKPAEIEALDAECEAKKAGLKQREEELKAIQLAQKNNEGELKVKEEAIVKADGQLLQLKTNKEYQIKLLEIESIKADKSLIEEKILLGFDQVEAARKAVEAERALVASHEKEFAVRKKKIEDDIAIAQDQMKVKESQRGRLTPDVRPDLLGRYERILENKEGLAIVPVVDNACGGCFMHLTEQRIDQIKRSDQIVTCDMCARIVYLPDDL
ncbi:MAG: C4-type zinc ribbon domain-containing protein [Candidatus Omnitrophota bacterium]|nr:C4-type zinc ribbon domain-containing protein [Candidatus Omnitrophota bacterium]